MKTAIQLLGVTKRFRNNTAVADLDLTVPEGAIYGFIGPNGSGKTTTIRMILRIFQPDEGSVEVLGELHGKTADDRLGYLPEERGLYKRMKVRDLLTYYARLKGFYDCQREIDLWLERLGATGWDRKRIDSLSKGMAQKVQFISAVVARPQLVILDEPFTGLDPVNMESLKESVLWLRDQGTTVLFSTHDMSMAERLCDTICMIHKGRKVLDGTLARIRDEYPTDRVRVRLPDPFVELTKLPGMADIERHGEFYEFRLTDPEDSGGVLQRLAAATPLEHFEVIRPSLHDIFVRIAKPEAGEPEPNEYVTN